MNHKINCTWLENLCFESEVNGHKIIVDADKSSGGDDKGPRPKPLMLTSLAGCTGIDVVMILGKMRVGLTYFNVAVEGTLTQKEPTYYKKIHIIYEFKEDDNLDKKKVQKAVELSQEKYCGVSALLR